MNQKEEFASAIEIDLHYWELLVRAANNLENQNDLVDFPGKRPVCKNCKFCDFIISVDDEYEYICRFMPTPVKKSPDDWCGQYEEHEINLDYILSFDEDKILRKGGVI